MIIGHELERTDHDTGHIHVLAFRCINCDQHWAVPTGTEDELLDRVCPTKFKEVVTEMIKHDEEWMQRVLAEEWLRPLIHTIVDEYMNKPLEPVEPILDIRWLELEEVEMK